MGCLDDILSMLVETISFIFTVSTYFFHTLSPRAYARSRSPLELRPKYASRSMLVKPQYVPF